MVNTVATPHGCGQNVATPPLNSTHTSLPYLVDVFGHDGCGLGTSRYRRGWGYMWTEIHALHTRVDLLRFLHYFTIQTIVPKLRGGEREGREVKGREVEGRRGGEGREGRSRGGEGRGGEVEGRGGEEVIDDPS